MPIPNDTLDIALLRTNTHEFILRCQRIIELIVKQFIKSGMFAPSQFEDVVQSVNEEMIRRLSGIERNYNGSVLLSTYMNVVIRNICLRIREREQSQLQTEPLTDEQIPNGTDHLNALLIQEEYQRLATALRLFDTKRTKIILCFRIYFRTPIPVKDIRSCFPSAAPGDHQYLHQRFGGNYDDRLEIDNFNDIAPYMNGQEQNTTSGESLRRWTLEYLSRIIKLMNGTPPVKAHTKETIRILFEQFSME
jgi:RNA polymerase sigma factor (sigma-70 family)